MVMSESDKKPENKFEINIRNDKAIIIFYDDIQEGTDEGGNPKYTYNIYELEINNRENLEEQIQNNYTEYLEMAKEYSKKQKAADERTWRNSELEKTDKYLIEDYPSEYSKESILEYRQALRDYPAQNGFPYEAERPKIENFV